MSNQVAFFTFFVNEDLKYGAEISPSLSDGFAVKRDLTTFLKDYYRDFDQLNPGDLIIWSDCRGNFSPNGRKALEDNHRFPFDASQAEQHFEGSFSSRFLSILNNGSTAETSPKKFKFNAANCASGITKDVNLDWNIEEREFWNAIVKGNFQQSGCVLTLPDALNLFGREDLGNKLFIRECYPKLADLILNSSKFRYLIRGNPGIGKSFFLVYLLWRITQTKEDWSILYCSRQLKKPNVQLVVYMTKGAECFVSNDDYLEKWSERKNFFMLVDGLVPSRLGLPKTVLVSSPNKAIYSRYRKEGAETYFMPVWKLSEIETCRRQIFPLLDSTLVSTAFERWGGVPRCVLQLLNDEEEQRSLDAMIAKADPLAVNFVDSFDVDPTAVSHRLFHYDVDEKFKRNLVKFASNYIEDQITKLVFESEERRTKLWLQVTETSCQFGGLHGQIFGAMAHQYLSNGNTTLEIKSLPDYDNRAPEELKIPAATMQHFEFQAESELHKLDVDRYARPKRINQVSIDSLLIMRDNTTTDDLVCYLFQMTVSENHPVNYCGLEKIRSALIQNSAFANLKFQLVFIVPKSSFDSFKKTQTYLAADGKSDLQNQDIPWIEQKVAKIKVP